MWFADGSNYPGTANIRQRKQWFEQCLRIAHDQLSAGQRLLVEYKPFEPAFYHTDIGDWGMALLLARHAGPQARVLVDTGHHYQAQKSCHLVKAESLLQDAVATDVRPAIEARRNSKGLPKDPMEAFQQSGYLERITKERSVRNSQSVSSYA